jgi:hypothetical protein
MTFLPGSDIMAEPMVNLPGELARETGEYLSQRLDGARDLYLLALALGARPGGSPLFGRMIQEARIAGLDTSSIAVMLGKMNTGVGDSIRPELWARFEQLVADRAADRGPRRAPRRT